MDLDLIFFTTNVDIIYNAVEKEKINYILTAGLRSCTKIFKQSRMEPDQECTLKCLFLCLIGLFQLILCAKIISFTVQST